MSYKTILVHTDHSRHCEVRIEVAIRMAKQYGAHLIALYTEAPFVLPGYLIEASQEIVEAHRKAAEEAIAEARAVYKSKVSSIGYKDTEWRSTINHPVDAVRMQARYTDLVVVGQENPFDESNRNKGIPAQLVLVACRPVLVIPYAGSFLSIGRRILVAWNASCEATRAITNALPMLKRADSVTLMALSPKHEHQEEIFVTDIVHYLDRHGIKIEVLTDQVPDIDVGNALLSRAADLSADLLVMGGYGHSRLREWVLGGATQTILDSMTIPVLMSH